ncbi:hypothetical protein EMCRGX_G004661 [Ephydatia muelleri]
MDWARSQESGWGLRQCAGVDVFALHAKSQTSENRREKSLTMDFVATNHTYNSTNTTTPSCTPESLYIQVAGTVIFVLVWPFIAFDFKWFPLGRPGSALVGGTLMGLLLVLTQEGIYAELGKRSNLQTLYLLVGMMFLAYYYDREGLLQLVALRIFDRDRTGGPRPFRHALWKACLLSASLSAVVTNDATCVVVTPLLLKEHARQGRSRGELLPLLLGVATSANIGSASTYFGNPQNAFIAASSMDHISLVLFFEAALPAALVGMLLSVGLLYACYFRVLFPNQCRGRCRPGKEWRERGGNEEGVLPEELAVVSYSELKEEELEEEEEEGNDSIMSPDGKSHSPSNGDTEAASGSRLSGQPSCSSSLEPHPKATPMATPNMVEGPFPLLGEERSQCSPTTTSPTTTNTTAVSAREWLRKLTWRRGLFVAWLGLGTLTLVITLALPPNVASFNSGLVPVGVAVLTMLVDSLLNRCHAYEAMVRIDWTVILLFSGLFVWLEGFQVTCLPSRAFAATRGAMDICSVQGVLIFTLFVALGSNLLSNVPLVVLMTRFLPEFECPAHPGEGVADVAFRVRVAGMVLAWASTVAGNLTLIGSVANLIVAEKALKEAGFRLGFWGYVRFGAMSTVVVTLSGLPVVYFVSTVAKG